MSFLDSLTKRPKLTAAIAKATAARNAEGNKQDQLYEQAYHSFAGVLAGDAMRAEALYNWGFALLSHAQTKAADEAERLYQEAVAMFSFCRLLNPNYLGAAINGGVACMDLARLKAVSSDNDLYHMAEENFEKANSIQVGSASYNLACIYGLRNNFDACLKALQVSKEKGFLPKGEDIINDPDLATVKAQDWFIAFVEGLNKQPEPIAEKPALQATPEAAAAPVAKPAPVVSEPVVAAAVETPAPVQPEPAAAQPEPEPAPVQPEVIAEPEPVVEPEVVAEPEPVAVAVPQAAPQPIPQAAPQQSDSSEQAADDSISSEQLLARLKNKIEAELSPRPTDSVLMRHYDTLVAGILEAELPPRPTDSVLKRHYDALIASRLDA